MSVCAFFKYVNGLDAYFIHVDFNPHSIDTHTYFRRFFAVGLLRRDHLFFSSAVHYFILYMLKSVRLTQLLPFDTRTYLLNQHT